MDRAAQAYEAALAADRGDVLIRIEYARFLVSYARVYPQSDAAGRAVTIAQSAIALAPRNIGALVALAEAYRVDGRVADAERTAQLAREVSPNYAEQMLGSPGNDADLGSSLIAVSSP